MYAIQSIRSLEELWEFQIKKVSGRPGWFDKEDYAHLYGIY